MCLGQVKRRPISYTWRYQLYTSFQSSLMNRYRRPPISDHDAFEPLSRSPHFPRQFITDLEFFDRSREDFIRRKKEQKKGREKRKKILFENFGNRGSITGCGSGKMARARMDGSLARKRGERYSELRVDNLFPRLISL